MIEDGGVGDYLVVRRAKDLVCFVMVIQLLRTHVAVSYTHLTLPTIYSV